MQVSADLIGTVDPRGIFGIGGNPPRGEYTLEEVEGEWRITNPQDGLIMLQPDFERLYDRLQAYFLDPTLQRVVPDPRYLITGDAQPDRADQPRARGAVAVVERGGAQPAVR